MASNEVTIKVKLTENELLELFEDLAGLKNIMPIESEMSRAVDKIAEKWHVKIHQRMIDLTKKINEAAETLNA